MGSGRRDLRDRALVWDQRPRMMVRREYGDFCHCHRPHRALGQAAPRRSRPEAGTGVAPSRVRRVDRAGGIIHDYRLVA